MFLSSMTRCVNVPAQHPNTRLMLRWQVERLEAELEVWQMKNASLEKQVEELTARLRDAIQSQERMVSRHRQFHTKESEDAGKKAQEQQRQRQDSQIQEEKELRFEIQSLLEARRSSARSAESTMKERARRLEELRRQQADTWWHG